MGITTTTVLPPPVQQAFDMKLLAREMPYLIHDKFALKRSMSARNGNIMRMRRYNRLNVTTAPLGPSGITPPAQQLSAIDIDAQIQWYGSYVTITDQVALINQDPTLNEAASVLGQCMRETEDALVRNMLQATASVVNCTNGINADNPTELTRQDIDIVTRTLISSNARKISGVVEGQDKFGTGPVREAFFCMSHSDVIQDLENVIGFQSVAQYPSQMNILSAEWGSVANMRFLVSSEGASVAAASALGATVYNNFVVGEEAYACIDLEDANAEFIYRPLGYGDDPLLMRQSAGFKFAQAQRITNDSWCINLRSTLGL